MRISPRQWPEHYEYLGSDAHVFFREINGTWYQFMQLNEWDGTTIYTVDKQIEIPRQYGVELQWEIVHTIVSGWNAA